jgi:multisubunit Na+/H+ antiporter MnhE subunit
VEKIKLFSLMTTFWIVLSNPCTTGISYTGLYMKDVNRFLRTYLGCKYKYKVIYVIMLILIVLKDSIETIISIMFIIKYYYI